MHQSLILRVPPPLVPPPYGTIRLLVKGLDLDNDLKSLLIYTEILEKYNCCIGNAYLGKTEPRGERFSPNPWAREPIHSSRFARYPLRTCHEPCGSRIDQPHCRPYAAGKFSLSSCLASYRRTRYREPASTSFPALRKGSAPLSRTRVSSRRIDIPGRDVSPCSSPSVLPARA